MPYPNLPKQLWPVMEKCVSDVKADIKHPVDNPYSVCYASVTGTTKRGKTAAKKEADGTYILDPDVLPYLTGEKAVSASTPDAILECLVGVKEAADLLAGDKQAPAYCPECDKAYPKMNVGMKCPTCKTKLVEGKPATKEIGLQVLNENGLTTGVKAVQAGNDKYLVLWTSNAFRDREGELFLTQAWKEYLDRRSTNGRQDRAWFWHVKGSDYGTVVWQDLVGRMLVEVVKVDNTTRGEKMFHAMQHPEEFPTVAPLGWGTSHGFLYLAKDKASKEYTFVEKFETTTLPLHAASNLYGGIKEVLMANKGVTPAKTDALVALLGKEEADKIIAEATKASETLETQVDFKEGDAPAAADGNEAAADAAEDTDKTEGTQPEGEQLFELELDPDAVKSIASQVDVKSALKEALGDATILEILLTKVKEVLPGIISEELKKQVPAALHGSKEQVVHEALSGRIKLVPASAAKDGTVVPTQVMDVINAAMKGAGEAEGTKEAPVVPGDPFGTVLARIRSGKGITAGAQQ